MRCAIYTRYSSEMQKETSIEDQIRNCRRFAEQRRWKILENHIYADRAVSGASLNGRLQLSRLLDVVSTKPRPFDYVLVDDTSRLSRGRLEQGQIIEELKQNDVYVYFVSQNIDSRDEQAEDVILPIHGIVDTLYLKELATKTKRGMEGAVLNGHNPSGRLYGYDYEPILDPSGVKDKKTGLPKKLGVSIIINPEQAKTTH